MLLLIRKLNLPINSQTRIVYNKSDYSFSFIDCEEQRINSSILINDIQLHLDESSTIVSLDGFCPLMQAKVTSHYPLLIEKSQLQVIADTPFIPGVSLRYNSKRWPVYRNSKDGWICVGNLSSDFYLECLCGCVLGFSPKNSMDINALWIKHQTVDH